MKDRMTLLADLKQYASRYGCEFLYQEKPDLSDPVNQILEIRSRHNPSEQWAIHCFDDSVPDWELITECVKSITDIKSVQGSGIRAS